MVVILRDKLRDRIRDRIRDKIRDNLRDDLRDKISSDHFEINMCGYNVINETDTRGEYFESYEEQINRYIKEINRAKSNFKQLLISAIILAIILLII